MRGFVINGREEKIVSMLKRFGFDGYQSRAYFTLLLLGRSKANVLAKKSGVPLPRIYDALYSLADRQLVHVIENYPKSYEARRVERLVRNFVREKKREVMRAIEDGVRMRRMVERLRESIASFESVRTPVRIFTPRYKRARSYDEDEF